MTLKHDLADANYSESMSAVRIPPIQCLLTFEALARLRSVTLAAEELCVTPSAVSHRVRQLEQILGAKLFGRADFSLTTDGNKYLAHVREGLAILQKFPSSAAAQSHIRPMSLNCDPSTGSGQSSPLAANQVRQGSSGLRSSAAPSRSWGR